MDHAGGSGDLAGLFPEATVVLHPRAARHAIDPTRLITATKLSFGGDFEDTHGAIRPVPESQIKVVDDGETLDIGGRELQFFHAPGHATHQMAILDRKTGGLFCGEALGVPIPGEGDSVLPSVSIPELDVDQYLATIDKLRRLEPRMLFYSHEAGAREPRGIISQLAENTALLRDLVIEGLKNGDDLKTIERRAHDALAGRLGAGARAFGLAGIVLGYATYFRKQGLA
jgi:glyoxylase-like metal-dependent hydrolase (beta-lactamase superfamily II)